MTAELITVTRASPDCPQEILEILRGLQMKRTFFSLSILTLLSLTAFAQDPLKVAPEAYKLEF
jgi:hypothetical protein